MKGGGRGVQHHFPLLLEKKDPFVLLLPDVKKTALRWLLYAASITADREREKCVFLALPTKRSTFWPNSQCHLKIGSDGI